MGLISFYGKKLKVLFLLLDFSSVIDFSQTLELNFAKITGGKPCFCSVVFSANRLFS